MLDVTDRLIVIVGGGAVAARKAQGLLNAGAALVRVVSPTFHPEIPPAVQLVPEKYRPDHLNGAALVFAATDSPETNTAIVRDARQKGILVNRADSDETDPGDFTTPAVFSRGSVTLTVSTSGSPALAAKIRDDLAKKLDPRWVVLADAMQTLRPMLRDSAALDPALRRAVFRDLASDEAANILAAGGGDALRRWLAERYPQLT